MRWSNLAHCGHCDQDVPHVLRAGERNHRRERHVLAGINISVQQALVAMSDQF